MKAATVYACASWISADASVRATPLNALGVQLPAAHSAYERDGMGLHCARAESVARADQVRIQLRWTNAERAARPAVVRADLIALARGRPAYQLRSCLAVLEPGPAATATCTPR